MEAYAVFPKCNRFLVAKAEETERPRGNAAKELQVEDQLKSAMD
jgi:hypothetical protein